MHWCSVCALVRGGLYWKNLETFYLSPLRYMDIYLDLSSWEFMSLWYLGFMSEICNVEML